MTRTSTPRLPRRRAWSVRRLLAAFTAAAALLLAGAGAVATRVARDAAVDTAQSTARHAATQTAARVDHDAATLAAAARRAGSCAQAREEAATLPHVSLAANTPCRGAGPRLPDDAVATARRHDHTVAVADAGGAAVLAADAGDGAVLVATPPELVAGDDLQARLLPPDPPPAASSTCQWVRVDLDELPAQLWVGVTPTWTAPLREGVYLLGAVAATIALAWVVHSRVARPLVAVAARIHRGESATRDDESLPAEIAAVARSHDSHAAERDELRDELRAALARLDRAADAERRRVAALVHDDAMQTLSAARWLLPPDADDARLGRVHALLDDASTSLRSLLRDLHPPELVHDGLGDALTARLADPPFADTDAEVSVDCDADADAAAAALGDAARSAAYRALVELARNAVVHADASHVTVRLCRDGDMLRGDVVDDGRGVDAATLRARALRGHLGVVSTRESVRAHGGDLTVDGVAGHGTRATVTFPLPDDDEDADAD